MNIATHYTSIEIVFPSLVSYENNFGVRVNTSDFQNHSYRFKLSEFKKRGDSSVDYVGESMTESDFKSITDIQFRLLLNAPTGYGKFMISNMVLTEDNIITALNDSSDSNQNEYVLVYDLMGNYISEGLKSEVVSQLDSGKLFVLKSENSVSKIIK